MSQLRTTIITRNDYDFNWLLSSEAGILVRKGELAISIPTREAEQGETPIESSVTQDCPNGRVIDTTKDATMKIGSEDTFYRVVNQEAVLIPNGSAGVLTRLASTGTFTDATTGSAISVAKNQNDETEITVRQAKITSAPDSAEKTAQSGVLSDTDYLNLKELADFFKGDQQNVSSSTIESKIEEVSPNIAAGNGINITDSGNTKTVAVNLDDNHNASGIQDNAGSGLVFGENGGLAIDDSLEWRFACGGAN